MILQAAAAASRTVNVYYGRGNYPRVITWFFFTPSSSFGWLTESELCFFQYRESRSDGENYQFFPITASAGDFA